MMKRWNKIAAIRTTFILIFTGVSFLPCVAQRSEAVSGRVELWVSPDGSDLHPGTPGRPMATLHSALRKARELRRLSDPAVGGGVRIVLKGGTYELSETVTLRPEDSGTSDSRTVIEAAAGERPVLSGGLRVTGWRKAVGAVAGLPAVSKGKAWVASIPSIAGIPIVFRQLWVNDRKGVRASTLNDGPLNRILSVDKQHESLWIPDPEFAFADVDGLELVIHQWWAIANLRIKSMEIVNDRARLTFHQPESRIEFEHPWPAPFIDGENKYNGNSAFYFANAIGLLNEPGEWYADYRTGMLYYWPRAGEDLLNAAVIVPRLETLVRLEGTLDTPVSYVEFRDIGFEHSTWLRPSQAGHVPLQAGMYLIDAYKLSQPGTPDKASLENQAWIGRPPAAVALNGAVNVRFERCSFRHLAATGLDFVTGTHHSSVEGCLFSDIGGTGIQAGFFGDAAFEAHLPYNPSDTRQVCHHLSISNNLITDCTNEDWGCVGIGIGYAHDVSISHNEVSHVNYSGISVGWGWTKTISCMRNNLVHANEIHHFAKQMYDVGGIYTLSAQPGTKISQNSIHHLQDAPYAHMPEHYQYIYLDEGSSYVEVVDNWTEKDKFFSNSPGPGNEWKNNGPQVSDEIRNAAGPRPEYRALLSEMRKKFDERENDAAKRP